MTLHALIIMNTIKEYHKNGFHMYIVHTNWISGLKNTQEIETTMAFRATKQIG